MFVTPLNLALGTAVVVATSPRATLVGSAVVVDMVVVDKRLGCVGGKPGGSLRRFRVAKKFPSKPSRVRDVCCCCCCCCDWAGPGVTCVASFASLMRSTDVLCGVVADSLACDQSPADPVGRCCCCCSGADTPPTGVLCLLMRCRTKV